MMKKVSRNNYEIWMIDYFDGKLNAHEVKILMSFLHENPDLKEEFDSFENTGLGIEKVSYPDKTKLRKETIAAYEGIDEENYEEWFVSYHEEDLTAAQKELVESFVGINPQVKDEFELSGRLRLIPEKSVVFAQKEELKKKPGVAIYRWAASVAAAAILLLFIIIPGDRGTTLNTRRFTNINELPARSIPDFMTAGFIFEIAEIPDGAQEVQTALQVFPEEQDSFAQIQQIPSRDKSFNLIAYGEIKPAELTVPQQYDYNTIALAEESPQVQKKNGLFARIVKNLAGKVSGKNTGKKGKDSKNDPTFVRILDQSITVYNTLTGSESELVKTYDEEGKLRHYEFEGESISWSRDVASKENKD